MNFSVKASLFAVVASMMIILPGCNTPGRLAKKVEGDWNGTTLHFEKKSQIEGEYTPTFSFVRTDGRAGGTFTLSAQMSVTLPVNTPIDSLGTMPAAATATGLASVSGSWIADDVDDLELIYDVSTLSVTMDPNVEFEYADIWNGSDRPQSLAASPAVRKSFESKMTEGFRFTLKELDEIDDILFNADATKLTCKFDDAPQTLTRLNR